jgi:hypothetical protein
MARLVGGVFALSLLTGLGTLAIKELLIL